MYGSIRASLNHDWKDVMSTSYTGSANYNVGWSDAPNNKTNRNFSHSHTLANTFLLPFKMELSSDCSFQFQPKNNAFSKSINIIQWNASLQKKLLKNDEASIKFSVNDILNQNTGYNRNVSGNNVYESNRLVLKRYWLLTATWNFTKTL
ncbi:outer membrane beta-barrel protein [Paraflavitalea speifideaquila]|uniref:outer membrane beta-barrel protein n=1 Tax=Paraflavitalea speifideaquila TaxID=3076558 RepID=UPI0028E2FA91|nr:outer membrane beta-barrel protein [Paraflavitalea speifideiaquila]